MAEHGHSRSEYNRIILCVCVLSVFNYESAVGALMTGTYVCVYVFAVTTVCVAVCVCVSQCCLMRKSVSHTATVTD